jgi:hypothetical protein
LGFVLDQRQLLLLVLAVDDDLVLKGRKGKVNIVGKNDRGELQEEKSKNEISSIL